MSHKRKSSQGESPPAKRPSQSALESTDPPKAGNQFVYLAVEEEYGGYMERQQNVSEIYTTVEDANNRLLALAEDTDFDHDEWQTTYDEHGCLHSVAEDLETNGIELKVRRMEVKPPGSAPAVPVNLHRSSDKNSYDEGEDEDEEEEEEEEEVLHPK